jgi:hypothetical protein
MQALICVELGCDVYPSRGIQKCGVAKIPQYLKGISHLSNLEERANVLSNFYASWKHAAVKDQNFYLTMARALLYETCNEENHDNGKCLYMYEAPSELEEYLKEFAPADGSVAITNKLTVVDCHGFGHGSHKFLEAEGVFNCSKCNCGVQLCRHCATAVKNLATGS